MPPKPNISSSSSSSSGGLLPFWITGRLDQYFGKWPACQMAAMFYIHKLWTCLRRGQISVLLGRENEEVRDEAFAEFYQAASHDFVAYESTSPVPQLVASAHGIVLDLGPGSGNQLDRFDASKIEHIYGVEPNVAFREGFLARLKETKLGLDGKYTLLNCRLEELDLGAMVGGGKGVDCVVSMQVMCSMSDLESQIRHIHSLLKPGGELIFWEHCCNTRTETRIVQWLWSFIWPRVFGGCSFDRVTREKVVNAAEWESVEVEYDELVPWCTMPRLFGRVVKPKGR